MTRTAIPLSHPMFRSPEANRFFINTLNRKRALEHQQAPSSKHSAGTPTSRWIKCYIHPKDPLYEETTHNYP